MQITHNTEQSKWSLLMLRQVHKIDFHVENNDKDCKSKACDQVRIPIKEHYCTGLCSKLVKNLFSES